MTRKGIRVNTMKAFLDGAKCRLVYYGAAQSVYNWHKAGTCHLERSSPWNEIKQRVDRILAIANKSQDPGIYNVLGANCEEFAVWLKTGIYKGSKTQLSWAKNEFASSVGVPMLGGIKHCANHAGSKTFQKVITYGTERLLQTTAVALEAAEEAVTLNAQRGIEKAAVAASKYGVYAGVGAAVGVGLAVETAVTGYRIHQYKTDYKYTKCDLKSDIGRSWGVTVVCTGVGVACTLSLPVAWWAILPTVGSGLFCSWLFRKIESTWFHKSQKEKLYIEYGLNTKSAKEDLKRVRREILKLIVAEKLHPDLWPNDMKESEKKKRFEKYLWMTSLRDTLSKDIVRGYVSFDEEDNEHFPLMIKMK